MNSIKKTIFISSLFLLAMTSVFAQEEEIKSATTFGGSADFYYRYDFANADGNSLTSFTNSHDSFEIGMASIEASHKMGKASVFVDLGFGSRASEFSYTDKGDNSFMIKQLNMTYDFSPKFKVTLGGFATHIGYELVDAVDNKNYSMSYAFSRGPFLNTGVKAQYTSGKLSFMLGITNPTDFKTASEGGSNQKTFIGQIGYLAETGSAYLNFTTGSKNRNLNYFPTPIPTPIPVLTINDENASQIDLVLTKKINDKFSLGFNGTYAIIDNDFNSIGVETVNWFSGVVYANYTFSNKLSLAYRGEYFDDKDGYNFGVDNNIIANTLSLNFKEGNFTFIPELRFDTSSEDIFQKEDGTPKGSAASFLFATTYSF
ncbi:outer membrane beta-barrel protein [Flavobacterium sp.]|uniref:outer membrane beta-barrel protein n=1 Tax=Flavobacterium sp. TaxID=239 RepID=UPI00286E1DAD|nr:outer membrane beta-barrel protein [Flavobacterium sp.]